MSYWLLKSEPSAFGITDLVAAPNRITPWAVSYTHLDVYKRQVLHTLQGVEGGANVTLVRAEFVGRCV